MYNNFEQNVVDISVKETEIEVVGKQRKSSLLNLVIGKSDPEHELPSSVSFSGPTEPVKGLEFGLAGCLSIYRGLEK